MFRYALERLFDYMFQYLVSNLLQVKESENQETTETVNSALQLSATEESHSQTARDGTLLAEDNETDSVDKCCHIQVCFMDPIQKQIIKYNMTVKQSMKVVDVKKELCDQLKDNIDNWSNLAILFMGKELENNLEISGCDLGDYSMLHALDSSKVTRNTRSTDENIEQVNVPLSKLPTKLTTIDNSEILSANDLIADNAQQTATDNSGNKEKLYFFVYCQACDALRSGKLRVACDQCENGSILFSREPQDWSDVLTAGRIECKCFTPGCTGKVARFYFKCIDEAGHDHHHHQQQEKAKTSARVNTAEAVTPLNRLRRNNIGVSCLACLDSTVEVVLVFPGCDHVICLPCFRDYCKTALSERNLVWVDALGYTVNCPMDCEGSSIESAHLNLLEEHFYSLYARFSSEELVLRRGGMLCPHSNCDQALYPEKMPPTSCEVTECPKCRLVYCLLCTYEGVYAPVSCPYEGLIEQTNAELCASAQQADDTEMTIRPSTYLASLVEKFSLLRSLARSVTGAAGSGAGSAQAAPTRWQDTMSRLKIREIAKPCPKCRTPTERNGGCMHMICTRKRCNYNWCWICLTEWNTECMATHWFG